MGELTSNRIRATAVKLGLLGLLGAEGDGVFRALAGGGPGVKSVGPRLSLRFSGISTVWCLEP
ncbi:hypothetical protein [Streptomyces sp. NPDC093094]|uniref:hypothetical protein n=1 Tax=Streptomyces sp. NPDC093094 TaxID=3366026 RepID=UPI0037FC3D07